MKQRREDMNGFKIDYDILNKWKLTIVEYVLLRYLYDVHYGNKPSVKLGLKEDVASLMKKLQSNGYIKILKAAWSNPEERQLELREDIRTLFEGNKDHFTTWLGKFPIKTPSRRYLSPVDPDTIMGKKLRKKWNKLFKNNAEAAEKAIKVLEAEMEWRRKENKLEFMHNAETWLNQGNFEKYEYLLSDKKTQQAKIREDFE